MDWDKLRVFHAVAEAGSFTHAGETLNLSQSAVSRQISALEESLAVPLFHRHARGLILTEPGELLFRTAREVFAKLSMAEGLITESKDRPKGPLKITTTVGFGSTWLTPRIREFLDLYPEIQVTLLVDDTELDLSMREADVAIRMSPPRQPDLIQRHLVSVNVHVYAAPEYIKKHGMPQKAEDLDRHRIIVYGTDVRPPTAGVNWLLEAGAKPGHERKPILGVNNFYGMLRAVSSGLGLAALPDFMTSEVSHLVRVLPELTGPPVEAYFVYPEELRSSKRISVFRDFLLRKVAETQTRLKVGGSNSRQAQDSQSESPIAGPAWQVSESIAVFADEPPYIPGGPSQLIGPSFVHATLVAAVFPVILHWIEGFRD